MALEIFRAGTHIDRFGKTVTLTAADLRTSAEVYDPQVHQAPIWIDHRQPPEGNKGLVKRLFTGGVKLFAEPHKMVVAFAEEVKAGRYPALSPCFYEPTNPHNPVPGAYYLKELSFVQIPAVKGMQEPAFSEGLEEGTVAFSDWNNSQIASAFRGLREFLIANFPLEEVDQALPPFLIESLIAEAANVSQSALMAYSEFPQEHKEPGNVEISEGGTSPLSSSKLPTQPQTNEVNSMTVETPNETSFAERETALDQRERALEQREVVAFVEGLVENGQLMAGHKNRAIALLLRPNEAGVVAFGEGADRVEGSQAELLKQFLSELPKIVEFGELTPTEQPVASPEVIARKATEYRDQQAAKGTVVSFAEAVTHVTRQP